MLNLYHLEMFLAVVDTGSFSAAAESLHLTQPAVSEGVKALEGKLDTRLFDRRGRRAAVTPEGAGLDRSRAAAARAGRGGGSRRPAARRRHPRRAAPRHGHVGGRGLARRARRRLHRRPSRNALRAGPRPARGAARRPARRRDDCAFFASDPAAPTLPARWSPPMKWALVAPPGHAWLSGLPSEPRPPLKRLRGRPPRRLNAPATPATAEIDLDDLTEERVVLLGADGPLGQEARRELRALLAGRGLALAALRVAVEAPDFAGALRAVEEGAGVGLLPLALLDAYRGPAVAFRVAEEPLERRLYAVRDSRFLGAGAGAAWWAFLTGDAPPDGDPA